MKQIFDEKIEKEWLSGSAGEDLMGLLLNHDDYQNFSSEAIMILCQDNTKNLEKLFGTHNFIYKGEFKMKAWIVEVGGVKAIILCNNEKGTCIEVLESCDPIVVANEFISEIKGLSS